jgi:hypothetical protein
MRDDLLNRKQIYRLVEAQTLLEQWHHQYKLGDPTVQRVTIRRLLRQDWKSSNFGQFRRFTSSNYQNQNIINVY